MEITWKETLALQFQLFVDRIAFLLSAPVILFYFRIVRRHKVRDLDAIRSRYHELTRTKAPTVICANHLTMFDSIYLHCIFATARAYLREFRLLSWNLPAVENFKKTLILRTLTYVGKCIPIDRRGKSEHQRKVLDKVRYLLLQGELCTIFPEGGRSRSGFIEEENVTYGVGQILMGFENPRVLCVYLRGDHQDSMSDIAGQGDKFYVKLEVLYPQTEQKGLRGARDISRQIIHKLKEMEDEYFLWRNRVSGGKNPSRE